MTSPNKRALGSNISTASFWTRLSSRELSQSLVLFKWRTLMRAVKLRMGAVHCRRRRALGAGEKRGLTRMSRLANDS
jgi:hypothetical protein